ncbi:MAG: protein kinase [Planctomycetota bacterium]
MRRYLLEAPLGSGAHAVTYRVFDRHLSTDGIETRLAMKVFNAALSTVGSATIEAARTGSINHPAIARTLDHGSLPDGTPYMVMELADGTLSDPPPWLTGRALLHTLHQLLLGLQHAHDRGLVHGDIKPANVLVFGQDDRTEARIKLADFGVAKSIATLGASPSDGGDTLYGNLAFMAPEVVAGDQTTVQSDVYSVAGMIAYLFGSWDPERIGRPLADRGGSDMPPRLRRVLTASTVIDPDARTRSARRLAEQIDAVLHVRPIPEIDLPLSRLALLARRRPLSMGLAAAAAAALVGGATSHLAAREGLAFEAGRRESAAAFASWFETFNPAFSDRESIYDLTGRFALADSVDGVELLNWATGAELSIEERIEILRDRLAADEGLSAIDRFLVREQLIVHQLQSRLLYADTLELVELQRAALAGFVDAGPEYEQLDVLEAISRTKSAVIRPAEGEAFSEAEAREQMNVLEPFLRSFSDSKTGRLTADARRDPRVRLAARSLHWLGSPKMLDDPEVYAWIDREYRQ